MNIIKNNSLLSNKILLLVIYLLLLGHTNAASWSDGQYLDTGSWILCPIGFFWTSDVKTPCPTGRVARNLGNPGCVPWPDGKIISQNLNIKGSDMLQGNQIKIFSCCLEF